MLRHQVYQLLIASKFSSRVAHLQTIVKFDDDVKQLMRLGRMDPYRMEQLVVDLLTAMFTVVCGG
jgi:hypothetical protein